MRGGSLLVCLFALSALQACVQCGPRCAPCAVSCCPGAFVDQAPATAPAKPKPFATGKEKTTWEFLKNKYDKDGDGAITPEEHGRGQEAFRHLDKDRDGKIAAADFQLPDPMSQFVATMTIARYFQTDEDPLAISLAEVEAAFAAHDADRDGDLSPAEFEAARKKVDADADPDAPVPPMPPGVDPLKALITVADADASRSLSLAEMRKHFAARDSDGDGFWSMPPRRRGPPGAQRPTGPAPGTVAPDFTLEPPGGGKAVTLSRFKGEKPVALIFGSYT